MPVTRLFLLSRKGEAELRDGTIDAAIQALYPLGSAPWQRSVTFWSQRKTGQDENMLRVSNGALQAVVSVETHECLTLLRPPQSGARPDVLECDDEIIALLRAMAYVEQKEVKLTGECHSFGDLAIVSGRVLRRTNDTQVVGHFLAFSNRACDLLDQTQAAMREVQQMLLEELQVALGPQRLAVNELFVPAPMPQHIGNRFTAKHEALAYFWAASSV